MRMAGSGKEVTEGSSGAGGGGLFSSLGRWTATHLRMVVVLWIVVVGVFGAFAPRVDSALAGAGWQSSTSQSVLVRHILRTHFDGIGSSALEVVVVDHRSALENDPIGRSVVSKVEALLGRSPAIAKVIPPMPGMSLSSNGRTAVVLGGARENTNAMVKAAQQLATPMSQLSEGPVTVTLTGSSALWADFNAVNHSAMMKSEMLSWPVTLAVLILAFGSVVAAGLPLMLTLAGLVVAAGALVLLNAATPVSIWALNFALMFSLALGIDYSLFLVVRFRAALARRVEVAPLDRAAVVDSVAETLATAGKAVAFSALTVLASLASILIVPSPAFRSMALGIMLSVVAVLAATLTLLPAVLGRLGGSINALSIGRRGVRARPSGHRVEAALHSWGQMVWRHPLRLGVGALAVVLLAALPVFGLRTSMPSIAIIPQSSNASVGYYQVTRAFGPGFPGTLQVLLPSAAASRGLSLTRTTSGVSRVLPGPSGDGYVLEQVVPSSGPSSSATGALIGRLRQRLPQGSLVGGAVAENYDLEHALASATPIVFAMLLGVGFLLLLIALGAPLLAFAGVVVTGLSVAGAFGVARLIFQNGDLSGVLNFTPQGFIDAWGPLFFGAMVFGVAMDYTLFLLSTAKEHYDTHANPRLSLLGSVKSSGRVVVSAGLVMVAVFLTFALSGPLAPKEMGVILAVAVALDALVVRLVLLPIVLRLAGHHAWHRPTWLNRVLPVVRFAH